MAVHRSHAASNVGSEETLRITDDRYCRHCNEIALAYDPTAGEARCRSCGELA